MPLDSTLKNRLPLLGGAVALTLIGSGTALTWRTLNADPGVVVRVATDPEVAASPQGKAAPPIEGFRQGKKRPSAFGLPDYARGFDYHSLEAGTNGNLAGSSAFLVTQGNAAEVADYYLLELGRKGWELVWQKDTSAHPGNDPARKPLTGTRIRWIDTRYERQVTLLALDDPSEKHSVQAVLSWVRLPRATGTPRSDSGRSESPVANAARAAR